MPCISASTCTRMHQQTKQQPCCVRHTLSDIGQPQLYHIFCSVEADLLDRSEVLKTFVRDSDHDTWPRSALLPISCDQFTRWRAAVHTEVGDIQGLSTADYLSTLLVRVLHLMAHVQPRIAAFKRCTASLSQQTTAHRFVAYSTTTCSLIKLYTGGLWLSVALRQRAAASDWARSLA